VHKPASKLCSVTDTQALDEDSAAGLQKLRDKDAEIDAGIDQISRTIDNLTNIGAAMKDEVMNQNAKLEKIDGNMQKTTEKQTVVNARQRYLLK
jgi:methyl coenzyme M reductase gamma subunit